MKTLFIFAFLTMSLAATATPTGDPTLDYFTAKWLRKVGFSPGGWEAAEVRKNMAKDVQQWRRVAYNPRKVEVQKTQDAGTYVITLTDSKGNSCELWLDESGNIESIN